MSDWHWSTYRTPAGPRERHIAREADGAVELLCEGEAHPAVGDVHDAHCGECVRRLASAWKGEPGARMTVAEARALVAWAGIAECDRAIARERGVR